MISFNFGEAAERNLGLPFSIEWLQLGDRGSEYGVRRKNDGSLDEILQFTNIARPAISHERIHRLTGNQVDGFVHSP